MKKIIAIFLILIIMLTFVSCGEADTESLPSSSQTEVSDTQSGGESIVTSSSASSSDSSASETESTNSSVSYDPSSQQPSSSEIKLSSDTTVSINTSTVDFSNVELTTVPIAASLENLTTLTPVSILNDIKSAAKILKTASATGGENARFVENTDETTAALKLLRQKTDERIEEILTTPNLTIPDGAKVYYVSNSGNDQNNGLTPETAWASLSKASSVTGNSYSDTFVLFERGGLWRGQLVAQSYVTYSAYGTGDKPTIYASPFNAGGSENTHLWEKVTDNVWSISSNSLRSDIGTLVFDEGEYHAKKLIIMTLSGRVFDPYNDLDTDLEFYHDYNNGIVYLYSAENPATRFSSIEFNLGEHIIYVKGNYLTIDNLCIKYGGKHGVKASYTNGLTVKNCEFGWIGGSFQHPGSSYTRFGNAVEIWGYCADYTVTNNYIYQVYDAGITQQITLNDNATHTQKNILYSSNVIEYCNYSIEYWITSNDTNASYIDTFLIEDNYMWYAGRGLCEQRRDDYNACHIQGWRSYGRNRAINYVIRNNVMVDSLNYIICVSTNQYNPDGSDSMPVLNNNIMLASASTAFGVLRQADRLDNSEGKNINFSTTMFFSINASLNGDIFGIISDELYEKTKLIIK